MTMLIENPRLEEELKEQRKAWALTITTKSGRGCISWLRRQTTTIKNSSQD